MDLPLSEMPYHLLRSLVFDNLHASSLLNRYQQGLRASVAAHCSKLRLRFLNRCLEEQVLPNSLQHISRYNSSGEAFPIYWQQLLRDQIFSVKHEINEKFRFAYQLMQSVLQECPSDLAPYCTALTKRTLDHEKNVRQHNMDKKLQALCLKSQWGRFSHLECVSNLSSRELSKDQKSLLGLGLSFAMPPTAEEYIDLMASLQ